MRKEKNAPPWTLFSRPKSSRDRDSNQLVQIFGILFYPFPNNNKVKSAQLLEDSMVIMRQLIRLINDSDSQEAQGGRGEGGE